jgi:HlyD family secretion protein
MNHNEIRKRVLPLVLVVALAAGGWWWWSNRDVGTGAAEALGGTGTIEAEQVAITPQVTGRIVDLAVDEGDNVAQGDELYRLDDTLLKLAVQQAQSGVDAAKVNYDHVRGDSDSNKAEKAAAKAQHEQAKIALSMAKVQLGYATVASPLAGVVSSIALRPGENAVPGTTMATISNVASPTITIFVPEGLIGQVGVGRSASLTTDSTAERRYKATVVYVATQAEFAPSTLETKDQRVKLVYQVKLAVENPDGALKPGMPADVAFE